MLGKPQEPRQPDPRQEVHEYIESLKSEWHDALAMLHAELEVESRLGDVRAEPAR